MTKTEPAKSLGPHRQGASQPTRHAAKRVLDIILSSVALVLLALPMIGIALAIRLHDGGPALFRQDRVGFQGRVFKLLKFRSMVVDAEQIGSFATSAGDRRITRLGGFLRRTSLDELPQLLNVLKGDMSIVGPRPDVPAQEVFYSPEDWEKRHGVRPGITGLAQVTSRSLATAEQRLTLDLRYVDTVSLYADFKIMLMTFKQIFRNTGN